MPRPPARKELRPLPTASLHVLVALADGEKHGYAVMTAVEQLSDGVVKLGPGTLYGAIKRMLGDGLIEESELRPDPQLDDQRRRYYRLTGDGRALLTAELQRLHTLVTRAGFAPGATPRWQGA